MTDTEVQQILYGSTDHVDIDQYIRRKNKKRRLLLEGGEEEVDPDAQGMLMTFEGGPPDTSTISNGGLTLATTGSNFSWGYSIIDDKDFTEGGKYTVEVTCDTLASGIFMCMGLYDPAQTVSTSYAGNDDGLGALLQKTSGLARIYNGAAALSYEAMSPDLYLANGSVVTMAINLDDDEATFYVDGSTTGTFDLNRVTPTSNDLRVVFKMYGACTVSINTTILHPVTGFTAWA